HFIVTGSVAALELVEKASIWAGKIPFINGTNLTLANNLRMPGYTTNAINASARTTLRLNTPSVLTSSTSILILASNANTPSGAYLIMMSTIDKIILFAP